MSHSSFVANCKLKRKIVTKYTNIFTIEDDKVSDIRTYYVGKYYSVMTQMPSSKQKREILQAH